MRDKTIWEADAGTFMRVVVRPNSNEEDLIREMAEDLIVFDLKSSPQKGKANRELVKRLSSLLEISNSDVVIAAGHLSREKTLVIYGMRPSQVRERLETCINDK
ncbi:hypothetical protein EU537_07655 [Candidatus Thorarchaeota archaeon]|nr:MAG: hypothetical protein EU537_07655 [Candidatus Thorarchaeota archaeon]